MSAKTRAQLRLEATTSTNAEDALKLVKMAAARVKGGGASLLTTGLQNAGAQVHVERESGNRLAMSITSGHRLVELCTFSATAHEGNGKTSVRVGGMETYKTSQSTYLFIPIGPKMIAGYAPYKKFLQEVEVEIRAADPTASISIVSD